MPPLFIGPVEAVWVTTNLACLAITVFALIEAFRDYRVVKRLNGEAREIATKGDIRRESFRIVVNVLLLFFSLPSLLVDRHITLTPTLAGLMLVPVVLLGASALDLRERRRLSLLIARETAH